MGVVSASVLVAEKAGCVRVTDVGREVAVVGDAGIGAYVVGAALRNALIYHGRLAMAKSNEADDDHSDTQND